jgi:hypothetical protein
MIDRRKQTLDVRTEAHYSPLEGALSYALI